MDKLPVVVGTDIDSLEIANLYNKALEGVMRDQHFSDHSEHGEDYTSLALEVAYEAWKKIKATGSKPSISKMQNIARNKRVDRYREKCHRIKYDNRRIWINVFWNDIGMAKANKDTIFEFGSF